MSTPSDPLRSSSQHRTRSKTPPPRPTTPLRPPSRSSLRSSQTPTHGTLDGPSPLDALEPAFAELADGMADLEANFMHVQIMHESLSRFNECFASFLHGLKVNAFCVDFPEAPLPDSFRRARDNPRFQQQTPLDEGPLGKASRSEAGDVDQTFLTTDTSFVDNPPVSSTRSSRFSTPAPTRGAGTRGGRAGASGVPRGTAGRGRASGLARASGRGRGSFR